MFIDGAGGSLTPGDSSGGLDHEHELVGGFHTHDFEAGIGIQSGIGLSTTLGLVGVAGETDKKNHLPPYHGLCYIMYSGD